MKSILKKTYSVLITTLFVVLVTSFSFSPLNETGNKTASITSTTFAKNSLNFIIVSDWGWNGFKHQQEVADQMAKSADSIHSQYIVSCGDNFQINGVASITDPLWISNFENIYKEPSLLVDWFPVLGNHDYKGNSQAEIDYSHVSRRWRLLDRNYTIVKKVNDSISARLIFIDTSPFIDEYRTNPEVFPDLLQQDTTKEINWLRNVLENAHEKWIFVFGHHPICTATHYGSIKEMNAHIKPLLEKYHVQCYFCGHNHNLQHLHEKGKQIDYFITGTGGECYPPADRNESTLFSKLEPAFSIVSLHADSLSFCFVNTKGTIIYRYSRSTKN